MIDFLKSLLCLIGLHNNPIFKYQYYEEEVRECSHCHEQYSIRPLF